MKNFNATHRLLIIAGALALLASACGEDADSLGVGAQCAVSDDCLQDEGNITQECLPQFKGGYCGVVDCTGNADCPENSACVAHDDGRNYCFRTCVDKAECNENRDADNESNCSSSIDFTDGDMGFKACVPPSA